MGRRVWLTRLETDWKSLSAYIIPFALPYQSHRWPTQITMTSERHDLDLEASDAPSPNTDGPVPESEKSIGNMSNTSSPQDAKAGYLVEYDGPDDPLDPQNLPVWKKWSFSFVLGVITLSTTFASSVFSTATQAAADEFGVSNEVMTLGTALFILGVYHHSSPRWFGLVGDWSTNWWIVSGFAVGPMLYGPMSELWGRKKPLFAGHFLFIICQIPVGVARNVETIMLFRFLGGVTAAGPLSIVAGWFADFFNPVERGLALCLLSGTTLIGPILGPIIGGFMTQRWVLFMLSVHGWQIFFWWYT